MLLVKSFCRFRAAAFLSDSACLCRALGCTWTARAVHFGHRGLSSTMAQAPDFRPGSPQDPREPEAAVADALLQAKGAVVPVTPTRVPAALSGTFEDRRAPWTGRSSWLLQHACSPAAI